MKTCAMCGAKLKDGTPYSYSSKTGNRYCGDWKACDKRQRRKKRREKTVTS